MSEAEKCEEVLNADVEESCAKRSKVDNDDKTDADVVEIRSGSDDVSSTNIEDDSHDQEASSSRPAPLSNFKKMTKDPEKVLLNGEHSFAKDCGKLNVLIAVTGSVATIKIHELVNEIYRTAPANKVLIRIVTTRCAQYFFEPCDFSFPVYTDDDEWSMWQQRGDPILHIELRRWADLLLIAPLDANTMAKIANGICDNLLTCLTRAWDICKPVYFCPAMNTYMYEHPLTFKHMEVLTSLLQFKEIPSIEKELMCGDKGYGAMAPVQMIASVVVGEVKKKFALVTDCTSYPLSYSDMID